MRVEWERVSFAYPGRMPISSKGFSLRIEEGETVLLLGPSGSGKSTLALCLSGLIPHAIAGELVGNVRIDGADTRLKESGELAGMVGTVFQDPESYAVLNTVEDEVAFGLENIGVPSAEMEGRILDALSTTGLSAHRKVLVERLSGGQKQRLALASILAMKPGIIVLDEPTSNLDPAGTEDVFQTLRILKKSGRHTIVLIEHKLDDLTELVDRVAVLDEKGDLVICGKPETVFYEHADELERLGIWLPKAVELALRLRQAGIQVQDAPMSVKQLADALEHAARSGSAESIRSLVFDAAVAGDSSDPHTIASDNCPLLEIRPTGSPSHGGVWLKPIELQVRRGEFWAVLGENGAGKTMLARHLMGLMRVRQGVIYFEGRDCTSYSASELARKIGYVFQNPEHQFVTERVYDEIAFGLNGLGLSREESAVTVDRLLVRFGLSKYSDVHPYQLSHGQKRRLSVAVMLAVGQQLLILDEPTFGQDRRHAIELMDMLKELQRDGRTIVMITHDMPLVAEYAEYAAVLSEGELLSAGPVDQLFMDRKLLTEAGLRLPPAAELTRLLDERLSPERRFTVGGHK